MKTFAVILLLILGTTTMFGQKYVEAHGAPYSQTLYGAASFAADSHYIDIPRGWMKVTAKLDTTAGTTTAWICFNRDSLNAIPIRPGTGGAYGDGQSFLIRDRTFYSVKGTVPLTVTIE